MPELPEVEVVRRGLAEHVTGRQIGDVVVAHPRAVRRQPGGAAEFAGRLRGRTLLDARRRGKFLWLATDDPDLVMSAHLGMSGQFRVAQAQPELHARVGLDLGGQQLWFVDQRTFGWVAAEELVVDRHGQRVPGSVAGIALDAADPALNATAVARVMRSRNVAIKRLLLDQSIVSGIGNIYADESLWRARVHPEAPAPRLSVPRLVSLLAAAKEVMAESLAAGGTSFDRLYVNVNGASGYFSRGLAVYGRAGQPCPRCARPIRRVTFMNRSSHFCSNCQRRPRAQD